MHEIRPQRRHTREALRNRPPIIPRLARLHAIIHILEPRRPLEVLMRIPDMFLGNGGRVRAAIPRGAGTPLARIAPQLLVAQPLLCAAVLGLDVGSGVVDFGRDLDGGEARGRFPRVLEHVGPEDFPGSDVFDQRHVDGVKMGIRVPIGEQVRDEFGREGRRAGDDARVVVAVEEGVREGYAFDAADGGFHGAADGAAREAEDGCAVAAVVGARDYEVDGPAAGEVVVEPDLHA